MMKMKMKMKMMMMTMMKMMMTMTMEVIMVMHLPHWIMRLHQIFRLIRVTELCLSTKITC